HHPNIKIATCLPRRGTIRNEEETRTIRRDKRVSVRILSGERRHLRCTPLPILQSREGDGPEAEIRRTLDEIEHLAIGCELRMRLILSRRDHAFGKYSGLAADSLSLRSAYPAYLARRN